VYLKDRLGLKELKETTKEWVEYYDKIQMIFTMAEWWKKHPDKKEQKLIFFLSKKLGSTSE